MSILIKNMEMPKDGDVLMVRKDDDGKTYIKGLHTWGYSAELIELPPHGRLIDADALRQSMYHEAFETDSPMQKWDSGCWIRYKMFERLEGNAPTIIEAEGEP